MNSLEIYNIEEHFANGLMRNIDINATISLLMNSNKNENKILKYFTFDKKPANTNIGSKSRQKITNHAMNSNSVNETM